MINKMHLCLASYLSLFSISFFIVHGYGYHTATVKNLKCLLAVPGIAEPAQALAVWNFSLTIMTTSAGNAAEMPFISKRYPSDLVHHTP